MGNNDMSIAELEREIEVSELEHRFCRWCRTWLDANEFTYKYGFHNPQHTRYICDFCWRKYRRLTKAYWIAGKKFPGMKHMHRARRVWRVTTNEERVA